MREILYRAKITGSDNWAEGTPIYTDDGKWFEMMHVKVDGEFKELYIRGETLIQYSGERDKNDDKLFEGDLFKIGAAKEIYEVRFFYGCFMAFWNGKQCGLIGELKQCFIEKIGNIHEPKL